MIPRLCVLLAFACLHTPAIAQLVDPAPEQAFVSGAEKEIIEAALPELPDKVPALRLTIPEQPQNQWDAQVSFPSLEAIEQGDVITTSMWMRGKALNAADGAALIELDFERKGAPYTKSLQFPAFLTEEWQLIRTKCRSKENYDVDGSHITLKLGFLAQWFEVAGIEVKNHGKEVDFDALESNTITYNGREADAPWRAEADARIEKHRKADLKIIVVDKHGKPVPNTKVRALQKSHDFAFGTAVSIDTFRESSAKGDIYREKLQQYFNSATLENGLKWKMWESNWPGVLNTLAGLDDLEKMNLSTRGHVMIWPGERYLPPRVKELYDNPEELQKAISERIATIAGASRGLIDDWDVVNEVYDNPDLTNILGEEAPIEWFKEARKYLPDTDLYYNDYAGLVAAGLDTGHKRHFEKTLKMLVDGGAPIDGLGIQGHFGLLLTPPDKLVEELDRWAKFGLKIKITEFDISMDDWQLQGDYTRDFLTAMFSHPSVEGVTAWGFWEGRHWKTNAAFLWTDWSEKPAGKAWRELMTQTWHTDEEVMTDENGEATIRGFRGRYEIRTNGPTRYTDLTKDGAIVTLGQW